MIGSNRRKVVRGMVVLLVLAFVQPALSAWAGDAKLEKLKAAFVYNFVKFISWPDSAYAGGSSTVICTVGASPINALLKAGASGKTVAGHEVEVREFDAGVEPSALSGCHLVFVTEDADGRRDDLLAFAKGKPMAAVGESDGFISAGGTLNFILEGSKLRVQLSQSQADAAGLKVSAKLQQVAVLAD